MLPEGESDIGDWADDELRSTLQSNFGIGSDAGLPRELRFRAGVARLIRRRLDYLGDTAPGTPSVFFLLPEGPPVKRDLESSPMLDNGISPLDGRLWFVGPQPASGNALVLDSWADDASVFDKATDELSIGHAPAVVFETRTAPPTARYYPHGLGSPDEYESLRLSTGTITIEDTAAVVDRVYLQNLITPAIQVGGAKLWIEPKTHRPMEDAEARIQGQLKAGLVGAFPTCRVRHEQTQAAGRLDLEIQEPMPSHPNGFVRHALLELKVLRSYGSGGAKISEREAQAAVREGLEQAASYGDELGIDARGLFCFDMRTVFTGRECFKPITGRAKKLKVSLYAWHLFASAKSYREWKFGGEKAA